MGKYVTRRPPSRCSFCGKDEHKVRLIAGPGVYICYECVALCSEVLAEDQGLGPPTAWASKTYCGGGRRGLRGWLRNLFELQALHPTATPRITRDIRL